MPPKSKKPVSGDQLVEAKKAMLNKLQRECEAQERFMQVYGDQRQRSNLASINLRKRICELNQQYEETERTTHDKSISMYRLYRGSQAQLNQRIELTQAVAKELRAQLQELRESLDRIKAEKEAEIAAKIRKINEQKQSMEEMAITFGVKLKETLEGMGDYIRAKGNLVEEEVM